MNWLINTIGSSLGKKLLMAVSGLCFCGFLVVHLVGNLTLYAGGDVFNSYAEHLHALGPVIVVFNLGLIFFACVHILTGATLFYQNLKARPSRYCVDKSAGGRTIGSRTMPYSGLILLVFVLLHLTNFTFVDKTGQTIYQIVSNLFANPVYVIFYVLCMVVVAVHVSHGFWSSFQTIGASHPKYMPIVKGAGLLFSLMVGFGFGLIPIFILLIA